MTLAMTLVMVAVMTTRCLPRSDLGCCRASCFSGLCLFSGGGTRRGRWESTTSLPSHTGTRLLILQKRLTASGSGKLARFKPAVHLVVREHRACEQDRRRRRRGGGHDGAAAAALMLVMILVMILVMMAVTVMNMAVVTGVRDFARPSFSPGRAHLCYVPSTDRSTPPFTVRGFSCSGRWREGSVPRSFSKPSFEKLASPVWPRQRVHRFHRVQLRRRRQQ